MSSSVPSRSLGKSPKVSVVMSVFNAEAYLKDAIQSVLDQTFKDFEFIIINDGSTDKSLGIIQDFALHDPRILIIDQDNTGLTVALRVGCEAAQGQYIARMDADDLSLPARFEKQVALLDNNPALVAATGDVEHFDDAGKVLSIARLREDPRLIRFYNSFANHLGGHGQVMFQRAAYEEAGGYDTGYSTAQDYDLWSRLLLLGDFGNVPEVI
ncbi:MAG: glycosyltransferase, partial [Pseudomonadota bacterium]